jgi:hypothetical protein
MSTNGIKKIELPVNIIVRDLAQKIEKSPIDLIKKLMTNGVMATINQPVDFDTAAIVVAEYGFEAASWKLWRKSPSGRPGEVPIWRQMIAGRTSPHSKAAPGGDHSRSRGPRQDQPARRHPPDGCGRGRGGRHHPAHRRVPGRNEGTSHYVPRYARSRGVSLPCARAAPRARTSSSWWWRPTTA